jgi:hypothetical protein
MALEALIVQYASDNGMSAAFVRQVIRRESNFNRRAVYHGVPAAPFSVLRLICVPLFRLPPSVLPAVPK